MKNIQTFIFLVVFSWGYTLSASIESGQAAPDFTLKDSTGLEHSLSDFAGKFVVLEWTNHKCPFVVKHYQEGHMQALQRSLGEEGVIWLQIVSSAEGKQGYLTAEEAEALRERTQTHSMAMLLDVTGEVGRAYGARVTPHVYLIDPQGFLIYQGAIDSVKSTRTSDIAGAENYVRAAYESAKAGESIENATTVPYGCGVKY